MMTKMVDKKIADMISIIDELQGDNTVPRNVKTNLQTCVTALQQDVEISLRVDKARHSLEEISGDSNLQPYIRTQLWNIASMLETL